jgi:predicted DNA-binding transcriptional regulator YafY
VTDRISKVQRWLDLLAYLVGRRLPVTVDELMERIPAYAIKWKPGSEKDRASVRRTFERDKDELREFGIPIETVEFTINYGMERAQGYQLKRRDFYLPYLRLLEQTAGPRPTAMGVAEFEIASEDAGLALNALRRISDVPSFPLQPEARSAFRKLAFDLEPERFDRPPVLDVGGPTDGDEGTLRVLSDALLAQKRVSFRYHGLSRNEETERDVAPYGLFFQRGNWYLIGHDNLRDAIRIFRTGRIRDPSINPARPQTTDYEIPPDFRLADYLEREAWELGDPEEEGLAVQVRFEFPRSLWVERNGHGELLREEPDGSTVRAFRVRQVNPFLRWILSLEGEATILSPPEVTDGLRQLAAQVVELYEDARSREEPRG